MVRGSPASQATRLRLIQTQGCAELASSERRRGGEAGEWRPSFAVAVEDNQCIAVDTPAPAYSIDKGFRLAEPVASRAQPNLSGSPPKVACEQVLGHPVQSATGGNKLCLRDVHKKLERRLGGFVTKSKEF